MTSRPAAWRCETCRCIRTLCHIIMYGHKFYTCSTMFAIRPRAMPEPSERVTTADPNFTMILFDESSVFLSSAFAKEVAIVNFSTYKNLLFSSKIKRKLQRTYCGLEVF